MAFQYTFRGFDIPSWESAAQDLVENRDVELELYLERAIPVGSLIMFGGLGNAIPTDFLLCDGSSLSTTTYARLFAVVGYTYGGSGVSFNLPSLVSSYVALGTSSTSASSGVRAGVALTSGNTSVDHSHNNILSPVSDQSANHTHANATVAANATHLHNNSSELGNATHSHTNGNITTGGQNFLSPSTGNHTHGYFKPNGSGANATTNATVHSDHYHFTNGGNTGADNAYHSHGYTNANADANHDHGMTNNVQSANHSHTVTLTNNTQSVTHTHASATGALVCFIIKYQ